MAYLTRNQLIEELDGPAAVAQLFPDRTTGGIDYTKLDGAIDDACGDLEAALGSRYQSQEAAPSRKLVRIARQLGAYYAWSRLKNKVMPETVRQMYGSAQMALEKIEASESKPSENAETRFGHDLDNSNNGRRATYATFRRGGLLGGR